MKDSLWKLNLICKSLRGYPTGLITNRWQILQWNTAQTHRVDHEPLPVVPVGFHDGVVQGMVVFAQGVSCSPPTNTRLEEQPPILIPAFGSAIPMPRTDLLSVQRQGVHRGSSLRSVGSLMEWAFNKRGACLHMEPQSQLRSSHSHSVILHQCVCFRFNSHTRQGASAATDLCDLLVCGNVLYMCFSGSELTRT